MARTRSSNRSPESLATIHIGGKFAIIVFVFTLLAFVVESEVAQYVQTTLNYRQPFFLFYIVHSSFAIIFPLHLLYLLVTTKHSATSILQGLAISISNHLAPGRKYAPGRFPYRQFIKLTLLLTIGISTPGLLWFASVSLSSMTDLTAMWNTNAFFAYLISVRLFKLKWQPLRLFAVVLATLGTFAVVYGGVTAGRETDHSDTSKRLASISNEGPGIPFKPSAPLVGNLLTLVASFGYGLYQVLYKIYAALPSDPEVASERRYEQIPDEESGPSNNTSVVFNTTDQDDDELSIVPSTHTTSTAENIALTAASTINAVYPPPFGLYPDLITSLLGFFTFVILWIPLPILHWTGAEPFRLPPDTWTWLSIMGISGGGVVFNAGFMVLLGVWGPVIVSVGNLLTIVLVLVADVLFGPGVGVLTIWSLVGSGGIVLAFGVLSYDMFTKKG